MSKLHHHKKKTIATYKSVVEDPKRLYQNSNRRSLLAHEKKH